MLSKLLKGEGELSSKSLTTLKTYALGENAKPFMWLE
jgi:hypothetical protein